MPCTWQINTSVQLDAKQKTLKIKNKKSGIPCIWQTDALVQRWIHKPKTLKIQTKNVGCHAHGKQIHSDIYFKGFGFWTHKPKTLKIVNNKISIS